MQRRPSSNAATSGVGSGASTGPIRSFKRTFSSSASTSTMKATTTTTTSASYSRTTSTAATTVPAKIIKNLPDSAYEFDLDDDDDDDWSAVMALESKASSSKTAVVSSSASNANRGGATGFRAATTMSKATSSTTTTPPKTIKSPPRAPPLPYTSTTAGLTTAPPTLPPASQYYQPSSLGLPKVASPPKIRNSTLSRKTPGEENLIHLDNKMQSEKGVTSIITTTTTSSKPAGLSAGALRPPFSKNHPSNLSKNQASLANFVVKADPGPSRWPPSKGGTRASSVDSTGGSTLTRKRDANSPAPWDAAAMAGSSSSSKLAKSENATSVSDAKGKTRLSSIGSLNVKQQIVLSAEQQQVLKLVVEGGKNVFFTGSAGTGKSILLREIISSLKRKYEKRGADRVAITASTGMAAANIGGTTIHSFAGIGLGAGDAEKLVDTVKKNRKAAGRWLRTEVLIIDEVSMLDGELFDKLAHIATRFRRKPGKPFGGIQLVMTGDFFQLPPVTKFGQPKFAFEANAWKECIDTTINLTKVFRQRDTEFIDMLNEMRFGNLSKESVVKFGKLKRQPKYDDGLDPTELFPMRDQVEKSNEARLAALPGDKHTFVAIDEGEDQGERLQKTLENVMAPRVLTLKVDAQVMLLKNMDNGLVNGSIGKVIAFTSAEEEMAAEDGNDRFLPVGEDDEEFNPTRSKLNRFAAPKSEGPDNQTDSATGQVKRSKNPLLTEKAPVVLWKLPEGGVLRMRMQREEFRVDDVGDKVKARRKQYPMICAWAMSIHKSQGQTLERVKCDLGRIFEKGQAYVALSRATSLDGLQVLNFNPQKVLAHPKVVAWTKTLTTISDSRL